MLMCLWAEETGSFHLRQPGTHGAGAKRVPPEKQDAGSKGEGGPVSSRGRERTEQVQRRCLLPGERGGPARHPENLNRKTQAPK